LWYAASASNRNEEGEEDLSISADASSFVGPGNNVCDTDSPVNVIENVCQDEDEDEDEEVEKLRNLSEQLKNNFIKPLHMLSQLSGYPNLVMLYSIFCSLAVSSASAERALSKLKIVKNRLRSSLCDDMLSSLMVIACEKDIIHAFPNDDIINRMASETPSLKTHLLYV